MDFILSKMDPRELPKGTRDPLGFEIIWTTTGRKIIGNLTTITRSIEEFITALLGFYLCVDGKNENDDRDRFIRYEQVAAYLRHKSGREKSGYIRGGNRVSARLEDENHTLQISIAKNDQILSSQSSYGLWGLYSTVLESTGLTKNRNVTQKGEIIIKNALSDDLATFFKSYVFGQETRELHRDKLEQWAPKIANFLQDTKLRENLLKFLLEGSEDSLQRNLFHRLCSIKKEELSSIAGVWELIFHIKKNGGDLGNTLEKIEQLDRVLTTANSLFNYLRVPENNSKSLNEIISDIKKKIEQPLNLNDSLSSFIKRGYSESLHNFILEINNRRYDKVVINLLEHHKSIMSSRKSAPWVEIVDDCLKVKVEESRAELNFSQEKHSYGYFLDSYLELFKSFNQTREGADS